MKNEGSQKKFARGFPINSSKNGDHWGGFHLPRINPPQTRQAGQQHKARGTGKGGEEAHLEGDEAGHGGFGL